MKFRLVESFSYRGSISSEKVVNCIKDAISIMEKLGYEFEPDLTFAECASHSYFGLFNYPDSEYGFCRIDISKYHFNDSENQITNTVLHEMAHYFAYKMSLEVGDLLWQGRKLVKPRNSRYKPHGYLWRKVANKITMYTDYDIQRTDHAEEGSEMEREAPEAKYIVKCENCGAEFKYQRKTDFVMNCDKPNPLTGKYRWKCGCGAKDKFKLIKGNR